MSTTMTTASGTVATISPRWLFPHMPLQRPIYWPHVTKLVNTWKWSQCGILTVHPWNPHIIKYLAKKEIAKLDIDINRAFHVSNGDHRLEAVRVLFGPDFMFTADHAAKGLIPRHAEVNSPVMLTCLISEDDPVDTFIDQNNNLKVTAAHKFVIKMYRGDEPENSLYRTVTSQYYIRAEFDSGPVGDKKNTTAACHTLIGTWNLNRQRVIDMLDIVTTTYKDNGVIDPTALSEGFMRGVIATLTTCQRLHFDTPAVNRAFTVLKKRGWSAFTISRFCQSTGSRAIVNKTRQLLLYLVTEQIKTGKAPTPESIDLITLGDKFEK